MRKDDANRRVDAFAGRPADYVARTREAIRARMLAALDGRPYAGVIAALAIGDERAIPAAQWQLFNRTGVGHLISISGLHITFFATLIGAAMYWLWRRSHALTTRLPARKAAAVAGVVAAFVYVLLAGFQIPAQRTLYMLAVAAIGLWLGRPGTASVVWLWALAVVLAWDPWASLTPGFWLSFGAVGLLLYIGVGRIGRAPAWREATRAQAAITLGLIPLDAGPVPADIHRLAIGQRGRHPRRHFHGGAPGAGGDRGALGPVARRRARSLLVCGGFLELLSRLPSAVWEQHAPPTWAAIAGAVGVLWLLAPRGVPGRLFGFVWLMPLFVVVPLLPAPGAFQLTVLDVGQGLAVLVQTNQHALLYDTGPRFNETADAGNRIIAPMLRSIGVAHLDVLMVSHQDTDHSGGAMSLLETVPVGSLLSSLPEGHPLVRTRTEHGESANRCMAGDKWTWDGVEFVILHPVAPNFSNPKLKPNDLSCVLRVANAAGSALLTGDIEARTEADLVRRSGDALHADVLVVPHHGSKTSSTPAFIAAVHPDTAVFTPGYRNRFRHPRPEIVERYDAAGVRSYRTDYDGAVTITIGDGQTREPRLERAQRARYWRETPQRGDLPPLE